MADPNFFPGFEGDDEPKKPAPAAKQEAPKPPAFDPFAGTEVKPPSAADPAAPPPPAPAAKSAPPRAAPSPPPPPADEDADLKPGSRKDLWKCPHCGAGNKPDRTTCRLCGKSPSDPVVVPWHANNLVRAGLVAGVVLVIVLVMLLTRADLSLRQAQLDQVDAQRPRIGQSASAFYDLSGGIRFEAEKRISVCGRVAAIKTGPGGTQLVALALGAAASDAKPACSEAGKGYDIPGGVVLACSGDKPLTVKPGQFLSLAGETGVLVKEAAIVREPEGMIPVRVAESLVGE